MNFFSVWKIAVLHTESHRAWEEKKSVTNAALALGSSAVAVAGLEPHSFLSCSGLCFLHWILLRSPHWTWTFWFSFSLREGERNPPTQDICLPLPPEYKNCVHACPGWWLCLLVFCCLVWWSSVFVRGLVAMTLAHVLLIWVTRPWPMCHTCSTCMWYMQSEMEAEHTQESLGPVWAT